MNFPIFENTKTTPEMISTLIIDDEDHIRTTLSRFLKKYCPQINLIGEANSVASAEKAIIKHHPDLILLDIKMDDGTGFDLLRRIDNIDFKVIFVTAYEQYALQAFKFSAIDYILKPVNPEELAEAVGRAEEMMQEDFNSQLTVLENNLNADDQQKRKLVLKTQDNIHLIDVKDISHCESDGCYTTVYTDRNEAIIVSKPLKEYDELLNRSGFFRVHKSYLINLSSIRRFEKQDGGYVILSNDARVPVASRKKDELLKIFEKLTY